MSLVKNLELFLICFLGNLSLEILFVDILERKEGFLEYKKLF